MKHLIAKFLIDRAIDDGRPLSAWLAGVVQRDVALQEYETNQRAIVGQLSSDADAWAVGTKPTSVVSPASQSFETKSTWTVATLATCAAALVGLLIWVNATPSDQGDAFTTTPEPFEVEDVLGAVQKSRVALNDLSTDFEAASQIVPAKHDELNEIGKLTKGYVKEAGSIFGRGLAMLQR